MRSKTIFMMKYPSKKIITLFVILLGVSLLSGCGTIKRKPAHKSEDDLPVEVKLLDYTIQVGAFSYIDNALKLTEQLKTQGLDAYYFIHESGLYKVRFGNYVNFQTALSTARLLKERGSIADYYIVKPDDYEMASGHKDVDQIVRQDLITTAERFLGTPYLWGGVSEETGFDCSGLSMVVYRLNGINLPRTSREQYEVGRRISKKDLKRGDLVFFATGRFKRVSHVGIYKGDGTFIHAPSKGKGIKISSLNSAYYKQKFVGAKTYL